ncbi:MAG: citramalate synthase [Desulfobacteraceae bacterium 4572_130]|nr:MAG: citramalate synthase [Desulfobacteraceae bacterium 4572_130]
MKNIILYDTTLRDGMQGENISFSINDKIKIANKLDDIGIHYIEGGWPSSNHNTLQFFKLAKKIKFKNARLTAFGSTRRPYIKASQDLNLKALIECKATVITIFGKSWDLHIKKLMGNTLKENLLMIQDSILFLKKYDREIIYDAEHFYDGYFANPEYAIKCVEVAIKSGCSSIVLCDTNGGTMPHDIERITSIVYRKINDKFNFKINLGIHSHNDCGLALANSISAVRAGASMIHGTINGYGERCGNTDLTSIMPILSLKMNIKCISKSNLKKIKSLSRFISETANITPLNYRPFVGKSAFAHKGGIHVSGIMKEPRAYEHIDPFLVGNKRRVLVSAQSGKSNIRYKIKEMGLEFYKNGFNDKDILSSIKEKEDKGFQFDVAEGSLKILMEKLTNQFKPYFALESFRVTIEKNKQKPCYAYALIKIRVGHRIEITAAEGNGPVSALDNALRKALLKIFPEINDMHLVDFKVRVLEGSDGTDAKVRVLIESRDENNIFTTLGVSDDIIEASWQALADSFQYHLSINNK